MFSCGPSGQDYDAGPNLYSAGEIFDVLVEKADAAGVCREYDKALGRPTPMPYRNAFP
jgi:hypothetical protein